jgi:hypothetical protein
VSEDRSYEPITKSDLDRLAEFARRHRGRWFSLARPSNVYESRFLCSALCQGAALDFVDGKNGVKDFDIYEFYAEAAGVTIPYRTIWRYDFAASKFGKQKRSKVHPEFIGRRVDLMVRSLPVQPRTDPIQAVRSYLRERTTSTAWNLAQKAVVLLEPEQLRGSAIWPF